MRIKTVIYEWFQDYKTPSMFIGTISCGGKCCREASIPLSVCQNDGWRSRAPVMVDDKEIISRYLSDPITSAIIFGGLEPFEQYEELKTFISTLRNEYHCKDTVVIYTGYYENEIKQYTDELITLAENIIIKFGRYKPNSVNRYDDVLGVTLASDNQYAKKIS